MMRSVIILNSRISWCKAILSTTHWLVWRGIIGLGQYGNPQLLDMPFIIMLARAGLRLLQDPRP